MAATQKQRTCEFKPGANICLHCMINQKADILKLERQLNGLNVLTVRDRTPLAVAAAAALLATLALQPTLASVTKPVPVILG